MMADAPTTQDDPDLKAEFDQARLAGDHDRMAELGPQLWPEPAAEETIASPGKVVTAKPRADLGETIDIARFGQSVATEADSRYREKGPGPLGETRAQLTAVQAQLGQHLLPERTRQALLGEQTRLQQAIYAQTEAAATLAPRVDPLSQESLDKLAETDLAPEDRAALREQGVTIIDWPDAPEDREWDMPVLNAVSAQLVAREIAPADLQRWMARGAALAQQEPAAEASDLDHLDPALVAAAQFALQAYLPDPVMRAKVTEFLEETGLGDDAEFITELAAKGAPLRRELEQARTERRALGTMNAGARDAIAMTASIEARYKKIYGGGP